MNAWMHGCVMVLVGATWCAAADGQTPSKLGSPTTASGDTESKIPALPPPEVLPDIQARPTDEDTGPGPAPRPLYPLGPARPTAPAALAPPAPSAPPAPPVPPVPPAAPSSPVAPAPPKAPTAPKPPDAPKPPPADPKQEDKTAEEKITEDVSLTAGRATLEETFERISDKLVFAPDDNFKLIFFGNLTGEMLFSTNRTLPEGAPALVAPDFGSDRPSVEVHARSTAIGMFVVGPEICGFQSGGLVHFYLWGEEVLNDRYGIFVSQAFAELRNNEWRFSVGYQDDLLAPLAPGTINWTRGWTAGNAGYLRGQFRAERFINPAPAYQVILQGALTEPVVSSFSRSLGRNEDNGWPNVEGRVALALGPVNGCAAGCGMAPRRPLEIGLSSVIGELRSSGIEDSTANVWAFAMDGRWAATDRLGFQGEIVHGQAIGSYLGTAGQTFNVLGRGIRSTGGWAEVYWFWTPSLHSHFGWGVDNPRDRDLNATQVRCNEFCFANLIWDVTKYFEVGFEVGYRETHYAAPLRDNQATTFHTRVQLKF